MKIGNSFARRILTIVLSTSMMLSIIPTNFSSALDPELVSIAVTQNPTRMSYLVGDTIDTTGMIVTGTYDDNSTQAITGYTLSKTTGLATTDETNGITITYQTKTTVIYPYVRAANALRTTVFPDEASSTGRIKTWGPPKVNNVWLTDGSLEDKSTLSGNFWTNVGTLYGALYVSPKLQPSFVDSGGAGLRKWDIGFDLGGTYVLNKIIPTFTKTDYPTFEVWYSNAETMPGTNLGDGWTKATNAIYPNSSTDITFDSIQARHIRFHPLSTNTTSTWIGTWNGMEFYGGLDPTYQSLEIATPPTKTSYLVGESFDSTGMVVRARYGDNSTQNVSGYTVTPSGSLSFGTTSVTISYTESSVTRTTTQAITVSELNVLVSIAVTEKPDKMSYVVGEVFNTTGMIVTGTYDDNSTQAITGYTLSKTTGLATTDETNGITITYQTKTTIIYPYVRSANTLKSTVFPDQTSSVGRIRAWGPPKVSNVWLTDGSLEEKASVTGNFWGAASFYGIFSNMQPAFVDGNGTGLRKWDVGFDLGGTYVLNKIKPTFTKTDYPTFEVWYSNAETMPGTNLGDGWTKATNAIYPNSSTDITFDTIKARHIRFHPLSTNTTSTWRGTWTGMEFYGFADPQPTYQSLEITTPPTKTSYIAGYEAFNSSGMVVRARYSDNSTETVTSYTVSPSGVLASGTTSVTISYTLKSVTHTITQAVTVKVLDSIAVTQNPTRMAYVVGDTFDTTGMQVTATFADSSTQAIIGYTLSKTTGLATTDETNGITITFHAKTTVIYPYVRATTTLRSTVFPDESSSTGRIKTWGPPKVNNVWVTDGSLEEKTTFSGNFWTNSVSTFYGALYVSPKLQPAFVDSGGAGLRKWDIGFDLGGTYVLNKIKPTFTKTDYPTFEVWYSNAETMPGTNLGDGWTKATNAIYPNSTTEITFDSIQARHIRFHPLSTNTTSTWRGTWTGMEFYGFRDPDSVPPTDKTALQAAIASANTKVSTNYTSVSFGALTTKLAAANSVNSNANATQAQADTATSELQAAITALVNFDAVQATVDKTSITVTSNTNTSIFEYSVDGTNFVSTLTITGLQTQTSYTVTVREIGTSTTKTAVVETLSILDEKETVFKTLFYQYIEYVIV
jgi:hypothetical protein